MMSAVETLGILCRFAPIRTARVSTARSSKWAYWDSVRYQIKLRVSDGMPINVAIDRANTTRRSVRMALIDLATLCRAEQRVPLSTIGEIDETTAEYVLHALRTMPDTVS